ncbi:hypothetical protein MHM87_19675 [Alteromonas sp. Cnat3-28]|uniref:hypothetical protein n=1 Tax=Alteromonas sp. Cnat3-28 TaxID=2917729 RepID=UPI001EF40B73|nr:hypothetical protein [Alteromonas sp. Cnat3-28]MCG7647797.1 hypothetical protein [Alteromonas sp. Cnat3-28]
MDISLEHLRKASLAFNKEDKYELLVLKTHLLIEEKLKEYLASAFYDCDSVMSMSLTFSQVFKLARALKSNENLNWFWESVGALNKLRNELAHDVNCDLTEELLDPVIRPIKKTGMAHLPNGGADFFKPIVGHLSFLYSQACHLATNEGIFKHRV